MTAIHQKRNLRYIKSTIIHTQNVWMALVPCTITDLVPGLDQKNSFSIWNLADGVFTPKLLIALKAKYHILID